MRFLFGAVTWPHEQDIAPETLLAEMVLVDEYNTPVAECLKRGCPPFNLKVISYDSSHHKGTHKGVRPFIFLFFIFLFFFKLDLQVFKHWKIVGNPVS